MKILVDGMPRTVGGIGSLIMNIAEVARNRNDDIVFEYLISDHSAYVSVLEEKGYKYYVTPRVKDVNKYKAFVTDVFRNNKYNYLWFNNTSKVNILLPQIAKQVGGARLITHPHGVDFEEKGIKKCLFRFLDKYHERKMFSMIDVPLACSEQAADVYYKGNPELRKNVKIIRNGIFTSKFRFSTSCRSKIRTELGLTEDDVLLGAVGRLTRVKNYSFLIELINDLPDNYKLIILGEGEDQERLQNQILNNGCENRCRLLGKKENINEYLSGMDYFLMPSFNEGMPYSIIEAQASGLRCVVSSTLSREVAITDLVEYAPINNKMAWIENLKDFPKGIDRLAYSEWIKASGFSIEDTYDVFVDSVS